MFKKVIITIIITSILSASLLAGPLFSIDKQKGGLVPCLTSLILDPRLGYMVNESKQNVRASSMPKVKKGKFPVRAPQGRLGSAMFSRKVAKASKV